MEDNKEKEQKENELKEISIELGEIKKELKTKQTEPQRNLGRNRGNEESGLHNILPIAKLEFEIAKMEFAIAGLQVKIANLEGGRRC